MPSHYDVKKKCRVGTMDDSQFESEADKANGAYFCGLMTAWSKAGGVFKWGAGGVSLRGKVDGKEISICFLAPQFAGKKDRIELACTTLKKQIGPARASELDKALRAAAGEQVLGNTMISIVEPGTLSAPKQKALTKAFVDLL